MVTGLFMAGMIGIMLYALPLFGYLIIFTVHLLLSAATGFGTVGGGSEAKMTGLLTPGDILFNKVPITSIDFFNFTNKGGTVEVIRNVTAEWFVILVGISLILLLVVLIYIAVRVLMSTAIDKFKYKEALTNWVVSVALLFLILGYAVAVIKVNNFFVNVISDTSKKYAELNSGMGNVNFTLNPFEWMAGVIIYGMFVRYTAIFLFQYIKRMVKIAFLIMISPLITVTYSIDKYADKKAQALSSWMTQFTSEVLMQPFHALIYLILLSLAANLVTSSFAGGIVAIVIFKFMFEAEKIVKSIFGVKPSASMKDGQKVTSAIVNSQIVKWGIDKVKKMPKYSNDPEKSKFSKFGEGKNIDVKDETKLPEGTQDNVDEKEETLSEEVVAEVYPDNTEETVTEVKEIEEESETAKEETKEEKAAEEEKKDKKEEGKEDSKEEKKELTEEEKEKLRKEKEKEKRRKILESSKHDILPFSFALATAGLEAADEGDSVIKNLVQGGALGYGIGKGLDNKLSYEIDKRKTKKLQADNFEQNVEFTAKEMAENASVYMALKNVDIDTTTEEGQKILLDWMENMEKKDAGSLAKTFESNKQKLIQKYVERDNISEIEAIGKVNDLEEEVLALGGSFMNVNEYSNDEREYLASMIEVKARSEKAEIESWTNEVDPNVMDVVKATVLEQYQKKNVEYSKPKEIKDRSDHSTMDEDTKKLDDKYVERIRHKDKRMDEYYKSYEDSIRKYNDKYNKTEEELEKEIGQGIEEFKKEHDKMLRDIAYKKHDINKAFETDYGLDPKSFIVDNKIENTVVDKFIKDNTPIKDQNREENKGKNKPKKPKESNETKEPKKDDSNKDNN